MKCSVFETTVRTLSLGVLALSTTSVVAEDFKFHRQNNSNVFGQTQSQPKAIHGSGAASMNQFRPQTQLPQNTNQKGSSSQPNLGTPRIKLPLNQNAIGNGAGQGSNTSTPQISIKPNKKFVVPQTDLKKEIGGPQVTPRDILEGPNRRNPNLSNNILDLNKDFQKRLKDELTKTPIKPIGPIQLPPANSNEGQGSGNAGGGNNGAPPSNDHEPDIDLGIGGGNGGNGPGNGGAGNGNGGAGNGNGGAGNGNNGGNGNGGANQPPADNPPQQNPPQDQNPPGIAPQPEWWLQILPWILQQQRQPLPQQILVQPQVIVEPAPENPAPAAADAEEPLNAVAQVINGETLTLLTNQTGNTTGHAIMEVKGRMLRLEIKSWQDDSVTVVLPQLLTNTKLPARLFLATEKGELLNDFSLEILPRAGR